MPEAPAPPLRNSRAAQVAGVLVLVLLGGIGLLPLFGGPGYEAALAAGVVLPSITAVATALTTRHTTLRPFEALSRGVTLGALLASMALAVSLLHGLRVGFCDLKSGVVLFLLGPLPGALMAGAWGALTGLVARSFSRYRVVLPVALAVFGPLGGVLISLWRFYTSPMVFAYDPFFGYFAGPLYDTVFDPVPQLLSYRAGSALTLCAAFVAALHLKSTTQGLRFHWLGRRGLVVLGGLAAVGSASLMAAGPSLGHFSTEESILGELERTVQSPRCIVHYDPTVLQRDAGAFARECSAHVEQIEAFFEMRGPERVRVLLFANESQKGRLMGAANTFIAKPWRKEVYLQFRRFPHPVLGHELAHVISGAFGAGPFKVSGPLGGWLPDPGRIEGIATAATPDEDEDLSLAQWARAMQELEILPPLSRVFRLSFLGENSSKAYTVAGAFVAWFHETYGAAALRSWYGGASLVALTGKDLGGLESEWHASLRRVTLDEPARLSAAARFDRPSVFGRRCPHEVDALSGQAFSKLRGGDLTGAADDFQRLLSLDPRHLGAKHGLASCALRSGDADGARAKYRAISEDGALHVMERMGAVEALGDLELALGNVAAARARYRAVLEKSQNADHRRSVEVKAYSPNPSGLRAVVALLVGDPRYGTDFPEAASWLGRWSVLSPEDGTADYLLGKNFMNAGRYEEARSRLDEALARTISLESVQAEALRTRGELACFLDETSRGAELSKVYLGRPDVSRARRAGFARFAARCGFLP